MALRNDWGAKRRGRRWPGALLIVLLLLAVTAGLYVWRQSVAREEAERQLGLDASRVVSEHFAAQAAIKVGALTGEVVARGRDEGGFGVLPSEQTARAPYAVDYFVDMRGVGPGAYRWDAATRTITVDVPDVAPSAPNIDETRAEVDQSGLFISRRAGLALARQTSQRATLRAAETARKPEHLDAARRNARAVLERFASAPLQAAGLGEVRVAVRFPWEGRPGLGDGERIDASRPIEDVLKDRARDQTKTP